MFDTILFLDFDGTITTEETLSGAMRLCIDPALYREKAQEMMEGKRTLADTVRFAFENIPSASLPEIMEYVRGVPIRPGFAELLSGMQAQGIPVVVISGGLQPYVEEKLAPYRDRLLAIHSVELDTSGAMMALHSPYERGGDMLDKPLIMAQYAYRRAVCVGDGLTDIRMATLCEKVFARDELAQALRRKGTPFTPWEDFFDVLQDMGRK